MKKRILSILLAMLMVTTTIDMSALVVQAAEEVQTESTGTYPIYVQGVQITDANAADVLGETDAGATVTYDADTATLTLNGAVLTAIRSKNSGLLYGIHASQELNLVLVGENTISGTDDSRDYGIKIDNSTLCISGEGSLTVAGNVSCGICAANGTTINSGILSLQCDYDGINGTTIIHGGTVYAEGEYGIRAKEEGTVTITGGTVTVNSTERSILGSGGVTITGGLVTLENTNFGCIFTDNRLILGGDVHVKATVKAKANAVHCGGGCKLADGFWGYYRNKADEVYIFAEKNIYNNGSYFEFVGVEHMDSTKRGTTHILSCKEGCAHSTSFGQKHFGGTATHIAKAICVICENTYGSIDENGHYGGIATCTELAVCEYEGCGQPYGELLPHQANPSTGICINCGIDLSAIIKVTADDFIQYPGNPDNLAACVEAAIAAGHTDITVTMPADADAYWFTPIRKGLIASGAAEGSINLTLAGVTAIPDHNELNAATAIFGLLMVDESGALLYGPDERVTQLGSISLPDATTVGASAFYGCSGLHSFSAPKVQNVGERAFEFTDIVSLELPEATTLEYASFLGCESLTSAKIPKVTNLGQQVFDRTALTYLELLAEGDISIHEEALGYPETFAGQIDLSLSCDKKDNITEGKTWNGFTFQSITADCLVYDDNGFCTVCGDYEPAQQVSETHFADLNSEYNGYYAIENAGQLFWFAKLVNSAGGTAVNAILTDNINLEELEWTPIGNSDNKFTGIFEGHEKKISNLVISGDNSNVGLFGYTSNGVINNLTVENARVSGYIGVGAVVGNPTTTELKNIVVTGHVEVNGVSYVGGVGGKDIAADWTDITVEVDETSYVNADSVADSGAYRTCVGGVIGYMAEGDYTIKDVSSNLDVLGSTSDIGGIVGVVMYGNNFENITCTGDVTNLTASPWDALDTGLIAGTWMNQVGYEVAFTDISVSGTLITPNVSDVTFPNDKLIGAAYYAENNTTDNSGILRIDNEQWWPLLPVNNMGTDAEITYDGSSYDVTELFAKDENAGDANYELLEGGTGVGELNGSVLTITQVGTFIIQMTTAAHDNYTEGNARATLTVNKAENAPNMPSDTMEVSNSKKTVGDISLPTDWAWSDADKNTTLEVGGDVTASAVYTGADKGNYIHTEVVITITTVKAENPFGDVQEDEWYYKFCVFANDNGLMKGKDTTEDGKVLFDPANTITRAEFVRILYNKENTPEVTYSEVFVDVEEGIWYTKAILWAYNNGIVSGKGEGIFDINGEITRLEIAQILYKYAVYKGYNVTTDAAADLTSFVDDEAVASWGHNAMKWAVGYDVVTGKETDGGYELAPDGSAIRAEAATMIKKFMMAYEDVSAE